jgi:hypothetical protein
VARKQFQWRAVCPVRDRTLTSIDASHDTEAGRRGPRVKNTAMHRDHRHILITYWMSNDRISVLDRTLSFEPVVMLRLRQTLPEASSGNARYGKYIPCTYKYRPFDSRLIDTIDSHGSFRRRTSTAHNLRRLHYALFHMHLDNMHIWTERHMSSNQDLCERYGEICKV